MSELPIVNESMNQWILVGIELLGQLKMSNEGFCFTWLKNILVIFSPPSVIFFAFTLCQKHQICLFEPYHLHIFNLNVHLNLITKSTTSEKCNVEKILWKLSVEKFWALRTLIGRFGGGRALLCLPSEPGGQLPSGGGCCLQRCHCTEELMLNFTRAFGKRTLF